MGGQGLALTSGVAALFATCLLAATGWATSPAPEPAGAQAVSTAMPAPEDVVWYEVFVRSFQDSDGDGVGDLRGVTQRLDYLADLGIGGLWLMPIHPSPSYHGYDVTDYRDVNPEYGTVQDLVELLDAAHARGLRVIIDFVPNHTSSSHPWFQAALAGDPWYRDFYVWSEEPPNWRGNYGGSAWHPAGGSHYLGLFSPAMPDLNHRNEDVVTEIMSVARFWLELGVDGFRVDAIQHVVESPDGVTANAPENYAWVKMFQDFMSEVSPGALIVGETWTAMPAIARYHRESGLHMSFDYPIWRELTEAIQRRSASDLAFAIEQESALYPADAARATFTGNHDQTRLATQLSFPRRDERRIKLAASLLLTLPGTPFLYYGEELGMPDGPGTSDVEKRTPMRWEPGAGLGFTSGVPWASPGEDSTGVSVAEQTGDPGSVLEHYRTLIHVRNAYPALNRGAAAVLETGDPALLALERSHGDEALYVLANLSARELEAAGVDLPAGSYRDLVTGAVFEGVVPALTVLVLQAD